MMVLLNLYVQQQSTRIYHCPRNHQA